MGGSMQCTRSRGSGSGWERRRGTHRTWGERNRAWPHRKEDHAWPYRKVGERVLRRGEDVSHRESARRVWEADGAGERVRVHRMDVGSCGGEGMSTGGQERHMCRVTGTASGAGVHRVERATCTRIAHGSSAKAEAVERSARRAGKRHAERWGRECVALGWQCGEEALGGVGAAWVGGRTTVEER